MNNTRLRILGLILVASIGVHAYYDITRPRCIQLQFSTPAARHTLEASFRVSGPDLQAAALPEYDTLQEAGVRAIQRAYQCSVAYECGGVIAQRPNGKFVIGPVRSDYSGDSVQLNHSVPFGYKLVADFHTHPCNAASHTVPYFSPPDIENSVASHLIGFMGDLCTGAVHEFDPAHDKPDVEIPPGADVYMTQGRIVGKIALTKQPISQEPDTGL